MSPSLQTGEFSLRENIPGHPTRFHLMKKKETLVFQVCIRCGWLTSLDLMFAFLLRVDWVWTMYTFYVDLSALVVYMCYVYVNSMCIYYYGLCVVVCEVV